MALENWKAQSCDYTGVCYSGQLLIVRLYLCDNELGRGCYGVLPQH